MEKKRDEWSTLADMLGSLIEKYYDVLDIDSLPEPEIYEAETRKMSGDIEKSDVL